MEELRLELTQKNVEAAYDSVNLVNELNSKETLTEEETRRKEANLEHLRIMMAKPEFVSLLTATQKTEINSLIK